ncbi:hypothetical protein ENUP19_0102G0043 [Entamoeba nuttalli]
MNEIPVAQPIPQQLLHIENMSASSSVLTPSSFSLKIDQFVPNQQKSFLQGACPPPSGVPIPFDSVDFEHFHADFSSPNCPDENQLSEGSEEDTFDYKL